LNYIVHISLKQAPQTLKELLHEATTDDKSIVRKVAECMLHAATCLATLQKVETLSTFLHLAMQFFVARHILKRGCYTRNFVRNMSHNADALQVAEKFAPCNSTFMLLNFIQGTFSTIFCLDNKHGDNYLMHYF